MKKPPGEGRWGPGGRSAGHHQRKHIVAQVCDVLALEGEVLGLEPGNESSDAFLKSAVPADLDAAGHCANERVAAGVTNDVDTESVDGEQGEVFGHDWLGLSGGGPPLRCPNSSA
jgi:hypothetical protein